ncbi:hypothetical protein [Arenibacter echinorum]|uniref:Uncharacterized protein n=1 Tax=Arenibacter echinorum TaxID=440515 RepID=A0A327RG95_9FLAO|nr:hypothetical protein [Arenibacter echinorum]RAJ15919.1 hypothetical protein LV92_00623 [Arenibacter echinorum]
MMYFALICSSISKSSKQAVLGSNPSAITNNYEASKKLEAFLVLQKAQKRLTFFKSSRIIRIGIAAQSFTDYLSRDSRPGMVDGINDKILFNIRIFGDAF